MKETLNDLTGSSDIIISMANRDEMSILKLQNIRHSSDGVVP
jgi:hypothetical protein